MVKLAAYLFGAVRLTDGQCGTEIPLQPTPRRLLGFLAVHRDQILQRDMVAETLWPDQDPGNARRCLNSALFRLRQAVSAHDAPSPVRTPSSEEITIAAGDDFWLDIHCFETGIAVDPAATDSLSSEQIGGLEEAVAHFRAPLLGGIDDDWAVRERRRVESLYLDIRHLLALQSRRRGNWDSAIAHARHVLDIDPLREDIHCEIMRALYARGDRIGALRQFDRLKTLLWQELQVAPMPHTESLYRTISEGGAQETPQRSTKRTTTPAVPPAHNERTRLHVQVMRRRIRLLQQDSRRLLSAAEEMERLVERFDRALKGHSSE